VPECAKARLYSGLEFQKKIRRRTGLGTPRYPGRGSKERGKRREGGRVKRKEGSQGTGRKWKGQGMVREGCAPPKKNLPRIYTTVGYCC